MTYIGDRQFEPSRPVAADRAAEYVAAGWWGGRRLRDGLEAAASARPGDVALVDNERSMTWAELASFVAAGVSRLRAFRGPVVLIAGNTAAGVVAYQSLLRSGLPMAVLDRRCGPADVSAVVEALAPALVILPTNEAVRLGSACGTAFVLPLERFLEREPESGGWSEPDRDQVALVLFSSGTTGRPKGVLHSLNTLTAGAANMALITETTPDTIVFLVSPLTSITGVMQMHLVADQGARLILEDDFDPATSLRRLNQEGANLLGGAPVIVDRLVRASEAMSDHELTLRTLALGGSLLPRPLLNTVTDEYGIKVARVYGSSEAPNSTGSRPDDSREQRLSDDGAYTPGLEVKIGSSRHPQEGLLRGPALFLGYLDEADNESGFEDGWYRTGDLIETVSERVTVVGRLTEVVNRNGLKISLNEIDAALAGLPHADEWAAFGVPDQATGERLAVAVVPEQGAEISLADVAGHLTAAGLAVRKLPEQIVIWDQPLPRTPSGKVIRSRLENESVGRPQAVAARLQTDR